MFLVSSDSEETEDSKLHTLSQYNNKYERIYWLNAKKIDGICGLLIGVTKHRFCVHICWCSDSNPENIGFDFNRSRIYESYCIATREAIYLNTFLKELGVNHYVI